MDRFGLCCLLGVFGVTYEMKPDLVMMGESVTLHTDREMRNNDLILWRFGPENTVIAQISVKDGAVSVQDDCDGRFRGRLTVDRQTGCLTVLNTRREDAGRYELQTNRIKKTFSVVVNAFGDKETTPVSVMEGGSVTLNTDTDASSEQIQWEFGKYVLVQANRINDANLEESLRGRLSVDGESGSLTLTGARTEDAGLYRLTLPAGHRRLFLLSVYAPLPTPGIFSHCPSWSESRRVLLCAVMDASHVTLSWFKGSRLVSSVSVSESSVSLSLPLELDVEDPDPYSCVLNNSFAERTQRLNFTGLCQSGSVSVRGCDAVEAVIRLALSALMGVAAVAAVVVLVYDIRSRRAEHPQHKC